MRRLRRRARWRRIGANLRLDDPELGVAHAARPMASAAAHMNRRTTDFARGSRGVSSKNLASEAVRIRAEGERPPECRGSERDGHLVDQHVGRTPSARRTGLATKRSPHRALLDEQSSIARAPFSNPGRFESKTPTLARRRATKPAVSANSRLSMRAPWPSARYRAHANVVRARQSASSSCPRPDKNMPTSVSRTWPR